MNMRGARILNRMPPQGSTHLYKTYQVSSPLATHYRKASCQEVDCQHYTHGWRINMTSLQPQDLQAIKDSRRKYKVEDEEGTKWMVFEAGQPCFKASTHKVPLGRPEIYRVGRGDWRSYSPRTAYVHKKPEDWLDDFHTNQDRLIRIQQRG